MKKFLLLFSIFAVILNHANANEDVIIEIGDLLHSQKNEISKEYNEVTSNINSENNQHQEKLNKTFDSRNKEEMVLAENLTILEKGEPFSYPLKEGDIIECYAKRVDGSIDAFIEYNDYFVMKNGRLYSNTMHKLYKPEKKDEFKIVDRVSIKKDGKTLSMYDPLWDGGIRRHKRSIRINIQTGDYYMKATQDNYMWYRLAVATGYCRVK